MIGVSFIKLFYSKKCKGIYNIIINNASVKIFARLIIELNRQMTLNVYSHVMPNIKNEAMGLFEKIEYEQNMSKLNLQ